jgi:hypothetical protein
MKKHQTNSCPGGDEPNQHRRISGDCVNYQSEDGLVEIHTKVEGAWRFPKHAYPVVCLRLRPSPGTRIQTIPDGSGGLDVLLRHQEVAEHILALNAADPKGGYQMKPVPEKPRERKQHWDRINQQRWDKKRRR